MGQRVGKGRRRNGQGGPQLYPSCAQGFFADTTSPLGQEFILFGHNIWSAPFTASWVIGMLLSILGFSATAGIILTIVLIPLQSYIARCSEKFRSETLKYSDLRLKIVVLHRPQRLSNRARRSGLPWRASGR